MQNVLWLHGGRLIAGGPGDLFGLGVLFRLAAVSPHSVVFLPLPRSGEDLGSQGFSDLVLMRQEVGLKPAMWPAIRATIKAGKPGTLQAPAPRDRYTGSGWDWRDQALKVREHAGTVFISGTARALFAAGDELTACSLEEHHDESLHHYGEALIAQFNGPGKVGRRDDDWQIWIELRSRKKLPR